MLAYLITRSDDRLVPKGFYRCFILLTVVMIAAAVMVGDFPAGAGDSDRLYIRMVSGRELYSDWRQRTLLDLSADCG